MHNVLSARSGGTRTLVRDEPAPIQERRGGAPAAQQSRYAAFTGTTYNSETRTVEAVLATGARVKRYWWSEELDMAASAIDLSRVAQNQVRFLLGHNANDVIGVVERVWLETGALRAIIRFADTPRGLEFAGMVQRGELTGISIGYQVRTWRLVEVIDDDHEIWRAADWELLEASLVAVPADPNAGVRSIQPGQTSGSAAPQPSEDDMRRSLTAGGAMAALALGAARAVFRPETDAGQAAPASAAPTAPVLTETRAAPAPAPAPAPAAPAGGEPGSRAASLTVADTLLLTDQARALGVEVNVRSAFEAPGATRDSVSTAILEAAAARQAANTGGLPAGSAARVTVDEVGTRRTGVEAALLYGLRSGNGARVEAPAEAQPYLRHSVSELAAICLGEREMPRTAADRVQTFERAFHTTSDFPILLGNALNRRLQDNYEAAEPIYRRIATQMTFMDFRPHTVLRPGDFPTLKPVNEAGEIKFGTFGEKQEQVTVGAYGIQFGLSRQLMVNDHLGAIDRVLANQGQMVALFEEFTFFAMKNLNSGLGPVLLEDGKTVFHADHGNLAGAAAAITVASLSAARAAQRKQKNLSGVAMGLAPRILLASPDKETEAELILAPIAASQVAQVNPFSGRLEAVIGGQLTGNAWETYTDPSFGSNWTWGLLDGFTAPRLRVENVFGQQGAKVSLEHDFGCGAQDFRFGFRNPGA